MASRYNAKDMTRGDLISVDPFEVLVKEDLRGRHTPPTDEQVVDLALSMLSQGQLQPVVCRLTPNDRQFMLVAGFTRNAAARLIRTGFNHPDTGDAIKDENFKLKVIVTQANDEKAFVDNVVENAHRNQTSVIDDAHNQNRLREQYGYTDVKITELYRYRNTSKVGQLKRLLALPTPAQTLIHEGKLSMQAALDILDLDEDARNAALEKVYEDCAVNGKANTSEIRDHVRNILNDDDKIEEGGVTNNEGESTGEGKSRPKAKPRTLNNVKKFFETLKNGTEEEQPDPAVKEFASAMLMWLAGRRQDQYLTKEIQKLLDAERS